MKISFNMLTLVFYILLILSGYINYLVIFLSIMFMHEIGHVIMIKILGYKINSITILPTGGIIDTNINLNIKSNHLFLISIAGILMQIILLKIIPYSSSYSYQIFYKLNISLIIFNLLPINPLDGYKISLSLIERFFNVDPSVSFNLHDVDFKKLKVFLKDVDVFNLKREANTIKLSTLGYNEEFSVEDFSSDESINLNIFKKDLENLQGFIKVFFASGINYIISSTEQNKTVLFTCER